MSENNQNFEDRENLQETEKNSKKPVNIGREILEWVTSIALALVIALVLRNYVVTLVKVDGASMDETLAHNERLVVIRLGYEPKVGDIVIFDPENGSSNPYIKRVIATEGQSVRLVKTADGADVYVDDELIDEPYAYVSDPPRYTIGEGEYTVPKDHVFVMGDNRCNSHDSRMEDVGAVSEKQIMGKAALRIWPLSEMGTL